MPGSIGRRLLFWGLVALVAATPRLAEARCAFVDVNVALGTAPKEQCFDLQRQCNRVAQPWGCFKATLAFKPHWIRQPGQPDMRETASPFGFIDPVGIHWDVPPGFHTDGATIPVAFQPVIGGSWDARYVRAAVLHDFYIRRLTADPESVHRLFFHALLASGVTPDRAKLMYWAVRKYGPQWTAIDLPAYERERQANLARIERENEQFRAQYQQCLAQHLENLRAPPQRRVWTNCPLDGSHQFILDFVTITRDVIDRTLDDIRQGKCRKVAEGKYDCTPAASVPARGASALGACNYQCGATLCCVVATEAECAARAHSRFIEGDADACPSWAGSGGRQ